MDLERFTAAADEMVNRIPPLFLEGLNGGIVVRRRARRNPGDPAGVFILGEYITDPALGCYIALYWGSFVELFNGEEAAVWEAELWETIKHELRHHVEARAGEYALDLEDEAELAQMRAEAPPEEALPQPRRFRLQGKIKRPGRE
ncbi:MAG: metallopeptidase family protein [Bacillota bacterium]